MSHCYDGIFRGLESHSRKREREQSGVATRRRSPRAAESRVLLEWCGPLSAERPRARSRRTEPSGFHDDDTRDIAPIPPLYRHRFPVRKVARSRRWWMEPARWRVLYRVQMYLLDSEPVAPRESDVPSSSRALIHPAGREFFRDG